MARAPATLGLPRFARCSGAPPFAIPIMPLSTRVFSPIPPKRFDRRLVTFLTEPEISALLGRKVEGNTIGAVLILFMALLSFGGISTPSLPAQGEQRRSSNFNIQLGNPQTQLICRSHNLPWTRQGFTIYGLAQPR
jgi:hypothetical protein